MNSKIKKLEIQGKGLKKQHDTDKIKEFQNRLPQ